MSDLLRANLLSPIALAFALGVVARLIQSDFRVPKDLYNGLAIYLLLAIGLKGGVELSHSTFASIAAPALATVLLGCLTPILAYLVLRRIGGFDSSNAAGIAAHYGSGGLLAGLLMGENGWTAVRPFFDSGFKGALTLFLGRLTGVRERFYAISAERRLKHPAVVAISDAARGRLFG